jgi:hypothetical protein
MTRTTTQPSADLPAVIEICEGASTAFARAAVLIAEHGYVFNRTNPPYFFIMTGHVMITLELGEHRADDVARASDTIASTLASLKATQERNELKALELARETEERAAQQAELADQIAAAKAQLKKLEKAHNAL